MHISRQMKAALPLVSSLALFVLAAGPLQGCVKKDARPSGAAPEALHGTWRAEGEEPPSLDGAKSARSWEVLYTFGPKGFRMEGYPVKPSEGAVEVLRHEGQTYRLRLLPKGQEVEVVLDEAGTSFMLGGFRYTKTGPASAN